ncbi:MAG: hypothetical protein A2X40_02395 [Elusimicrobia bacterium GWC2_65_9]|nr:MAG: hypothetical protein A2X37_08945 [Elusimicrobia bacterium GWA2_66_18]OGR71448.1 MAG: hypothetical protein A2X40_02395 [Elusimicrobia bacterium GWC2_65_9]
MLEGLGVFAGFALLGIFQCAPSVTTGDAGEFAAAAATLSVPHAPGYPLFVLLSKALGTLVALGNWAYRTNLLSALAGAASLALLADALRRWGAGRAARLGAVLVLGLSPLWREQSAVTEVFALHLLCASLLLWMLSAAGERVLEPGPAAALGLVFGLGLANHQTLLLVLAALVLAGRGGPGRLPRAFAFAGLGALAGSALYAALPLRALRLPPLDWDHAVTPEAFWRLLARKDYGSLSLTVDGGQASGPEALAAQAWRSLKGVAVQLGPTGTILALLGAAGWKRSGLRLRAEAAWAWVLVTGPGFMMLGRPAFDAQTADALQRFHLLPLAGTALFVAAGVELLCRARPACGAAAAVIAAAAAFPAAARQSRRGDFLAYDYGRAILREVPPGAALVIDGGDDTFFSLAFLRFAQGLRPDLEMWDRGGVVFRHPYGADFRLLSKESKESRRRAVEAPLAEAGRLWYSTLGDGLLQGRPLTPAGLLRRPARPGAGREDDALGETLPSPRAPEASRRHRDRGLAAFFPFQRGVRFLARGDVETGVSWLELCADAGQDALWVSPAVSYALGVAGYHAMSRRDFASAQRAYHSWAGIEPAKAEPLANLGIALERSGRAREAEAALREAVRREPRSARAWSALGARLWADARWSESADAFASAAALDPAGAADAQWASRARARARARR